MVQIVPIVYKKMKSDGKALPDINLKDVFVNNFVSIVDRETFSKRFEGTRGFKVAEEGKQEQTRSFLTAIGPSLTKK